nr:hypothetical protein P5629_00185 [Bacillus subtilis]
MRKVTVSDDDEKSVAEYDKKTNKMYANGEQLDAEVQDFFKELANEEQININDDTLLTIQGYGDVPSGYKYKKGSTIKGDFAFVNASFSVVLAVISLRHPLLKTLLGDQSLGLHPQLSAPSQLLHSQFIGLEKHTQKQKGKINGLDGDLEFIETAKGKS